MWSKRHPVSRSRLTSSRPRASRLCPVSSTISSCHKGNVSSTLIGISAAGTSAYFSRLAMAFSDRAEPHNQRTFSYKTLHRRRSVTAITNRQKHENSGRCRFVQEERSQAGDERGGAFESK